MKELILNKNEERRILAGHLWIYSNEINTKLSPLKNFLPGELVTIETASNRKLGLGYINPHTLLCARLLTKNCNATIDTNFFIKRLKVALAWREKIFAKPFYRLIYAESDGLPGLIIDRYADVLVVQITTAGMENLKAEIIEALVATIKPRSILWRNDNAIRRTEGLDNYVSTAYGPEVASIDLEENSLHFSAAILQGQKTGWFYDQRNNRLRLRDYVKNARVLDVFSYTGSFAINAAFAGACEVIAIDSSEFALKQVKVNAEINKLATSIHTICDDAFIALSNLLNSQEKFAVIVLDPPAFIKRQKDFAQGFKAYLRLHNMALRLLEQHGILFTTSCSQHLSRDKLLDIIRQAGLECKRKLSIVEQLHQAQDHPIHPAITETEYLKGFIVRS